MLYTELPEDAVRQSIDSVAVFLEWRRCREIASRFVGGMYFKREGAYEYLVKTSPDNRQQRLGRRNEESEAIFNAFVQGKRLAEDRFASLKESLRKAERLNKAQRVGRVPDVVVAVLNALDAAGLAEHFTVVGTHALYAYESAAAVRIQSGALATQDVDLLWDARKRVQFVSAIKRIDSSMLGILQRADKSFTRMDGQLESAINDAGFMVDFLRREAVADDPHPFRFTEHEADLWPVQAKRAQVFLNQPLFEQVVVSTTGRMALMRTVSPQVFVDFKLWMAELPTRPAGKRRRDRLQAEIVTQMMREDLLPATPLGD